MKTFLKTLAFVAVVMSLSVSCKDRTEETVDSTTVVTDETYRSEPAETTTVVATDTTVIDTVAKP